MKRLGLAASTLLLGTLITGVALAKGDKDKDKDKDEAAKPAATAPASHEEHEHMHHGAMKEGADPKLQGIVYYRMAVMHGMGAESAAIKHIVKGDVARKADLAYEAAALNGAAKTIVDLFPAGTGPDKFVVRATPKIWSDSDGFKKAANDLQAATAHLVDVVNKGGDQATLLDAFTSVGKACGGCHHDFREKDDD